MGLRLEGVCRVWDSLGLGVFRGFCSGFSIYLSVAATACQVCRASKCLFLTHGVLTRRILPGFAGGVGFYSAFAGLMVWLLGISSPPPPLPYTNSLPQTLGFGYRGLRV